MAGVFKLGDGRYAVRGELVHSFRHGHMPEGTVIIDPEMVLEAIVRNNPDLSSIHIGDYINGQASGV